MVLHNIIYVSDVLILSRTMFKVLFEQWLFFVLFIFDDGTTFLAIRDIYWEITFSKISSLHYASQ